MQSSPIWLYERMYTEPTRERLRQIALWSPDPVFIYINTGQPNEPSYQLEEELKLFQSEGVVKFWQYEGERTYDESLAAFTADSPFIITKEMFKGVVRYVDEHLEQSVIPRPDDLGFDRLEGMLLEQVVLRRRFYSQALAVELGAHTIADAKKEHLKLYQRARKYAIAGATLEKFFESTGMPSLSLMTVDGYLELRRRSRHVLHDLIESVYAQIPDADRNIDATQAAIVAKLIEEYEKELTEILKHQSGSDAKKTTQAFVKGESYMKMESRITTLRLGGHIAQSASLTGQDPNAPYKLALVLLEWKGTNLGMGKTSQQV